MLINACFLRYQEKANYFSSLLREQPVSPLENAIFWVEHVIKHKGADHLKVFALKLPWYKFYMVDVVAFLLSVLLVLVIIFLLVIKFVCRLCNYKNFKRKVE